MVKNSHSVGIFPFNELIIYAASRNLFGVGIGSLKDKKYYILFSEGKPEGAIITDKTGTLVGDRAVYTLREADDYEFYPLNSALIERLILGCRIFDKSHIKRNLALDIPQVGKKSEGIGIFTMIIKKESIPQQGMKIMIRKDGQIMGSDFTNKEGKVSFKLKSGKYEIVLTRKDQGLSLYEVRFNPDVQRGPSVLDL